MFAAESYQATSGSIIQKKGSATKWGDDLGAEDEALIVADYDRPVFVMNYPKEAKAFYNYTLHYNYPCGILYSHSNILVIRYYLPARMG